MAKTVFIKSKSGDVSYPVTKADHVLLADGTSVKTKLETITTQLTSGTVNNATTVNSYTVNCDVPANAVFTDTTYTSLPADGGDADTVGGFYIVKKTQAEYTALTTKDENTLYVIVDATSDTSEAGD